MSLDAGSAPDSVPSDPIAPTTTATEPNEKMDVDHPTTSATEPEKPSEAINGDVSNATVTNGDAEADAPSAVDNDATNDADSSAKKHKRRSSGIPEHKAKKLNKKKSVPSLQLDAKPGDYFFARLKGYAPWPSMVADEEILPEKMLSTRPVTAKNANGTYRADFDEGGKNAKDRTYPVLFLGTYEFAWMPNTDLTPTNPGEMKEQGKPKKVSKHLSAAYDEAMEGHDLDYFKDLLVEHQRKIDEHIAETQRLEDEKEAKRAEKEAEKAAAKAEKAEKAAKRKSQAAAAGNPMNVDAEGGTGSAKKPVKKRKKEEGAEDADKPSKTPKKSKTLNLSQGANGESSASKPKAKKVPRPPKEPSPQLTPEEKDDTIKREVFYYRHKLQKGLLARDSVPQETDMKSLADYITLLEAYTDLDPKIIKETKIHKVLKGITRLPTIPKDQEFRFVERSAALLGKWGVESGSKDDSKGETKPNDAAPKVEEKTEDDKPGEAIPDPKAEAALEVAAEEEEKGPTKSDEGASGEPSAPNDSTEKTELPIGEAKHDETAAEAKAEDAAASAVDKTPATSS